MNQTIKNVIFGLFSSIGIIYFFILPVYIPIRALGIELQSYEKIMINSLDLILYFSQIAMLLACNSILLSIFYEPLSKRLFQQESLILSWYRAIALVYTGVFIATAYGVLNPKNIIHLYAWSGAHYFIISFFQLLIRAEINYSKQQNIPVPQANNYFGIVLNIAGVVTLAMFSWLYSSDYSDYYTKYSFVLEIGFFSYLLFVRKYYLSFKKIAEHYSFRKICTYCLIPVLALGIASTTSVLFMLSGCLGPVLILTFIVYLYKKLQKDVNKHDLQLIINIGLGYGLVLAALTGSVLAYLMKNGSLNLDAFNYAYSSEPFFSIVIGFLFTYYLLKRNAEMTRTTLRKAIYLLNAAVPIILSLFALAMTTKTLLLLLVFGTYAFLEYLSLFSVRQIAQQEEYKEFHGAKLTNFNSVVLNGLSPALLYLLIFSLSKLTSLALNQLLIMTLAILMIVSMIGNLRQKYVLRGESD